MCVLETECTIVVLFLVINRNRQFEEDSYRDGRRKDDKRKPGDKSTTKMKSKVILVVLMPRPFVLLLLGHCEFEYTDHTRLTVVKSNVTYYSIMKVTLTYVHFDITILKAYLPGTAEHMPPTFY